MKIQSKLLKSPTVSWHRATFCLLSHKTKHLIARLSHSVKKILILSEVALFIFSELNNFNQGVGTAYIMYMNS